MKRKSKFGVLAAALLAATCLCGPAIAASSSTSNSNSGANSTSTGIGIGGGNATSNTSSNATSGSTSIGGIGAGGNGGNASGSGTVNFTLNDPPAADPSSGDPSGTFTERFITTGTAIAPSIYNNNLCSLGASAAGGFLGGAFAIGFDRIDHGCDARAFASLLGHFAEINSIAAAHAADPQIRALAERNAIAYSTWANNYLCMANPDLAAAAPPGSNLCHMVATQTGMQVVPAPVPVASFAPAPRPVAVPVATYVPPPKPIIADAGPPVPHVYGTYEVVPTSRHTGPISGYDGPDYTDE